MRSKNVLVSFLAVVSIFVLALTLVSAADYSISSVEVNDVLISSSADNSVSVIAGETVKVEVRFTANVTDHDVLVEVELEGDRDDVQVKTESFDVEEGKRYRKVLVLEVPSDIVEDVLSEDMDFSVEIDGSDSDTREDFTLRVQRSSYNADIRLISTPQTVEAGDIFPVNIVLENIGYNDLDDVFVTASIPALGVEQIAFLGDIVAVECSDNEDDEDSLDLYNVEGLDRKCNEDDEDTVNARLLLEVPFGAESGIYSLEVTVDNDDTTLGGVKEIVVKNDFGAGGEVISTTVSKTVAVGEEANYEVLLVNPTNKLRVYRVITESSSDLSTSANPSVVAVPAGSSKTVSVSAMAASEGEYNFGVSVFSNDDLVSTVALSLEAEGRSAGASSPVVVLTIILAIIFIVLLIVLIVLLGKKPEKSEEFGESYY